MEINREKKAEQNTDTETTSQKKEVETDTGRPEGAKKKSPG